VKEGIAETAIEVGRFKGLGEMNPEQLRETAMALATRRVLPVAERMAAQTAHIFNLLMGKGEAASRRAWMEANGHLVDADI
jgi:topoisomerase-4 subunit B